MRHKSVVRICVIFFLLCITIALVSDFDKRKSLSKAKEFMRAAEEYMNDESFELALWNATEAPDSEGNNILINWWYNQNDDTYYFFVPKSLAEKGSQRCCYCYAARSSIVNHIRIVFILSGRA